MLPPLNSRHQNKTHAPALLLGTHPRLALLLAIFVISHPLGAQIPESDSDEIEAPSPTVVEYSLPKDRLGPINKSIFAFNHVTNKFLITPVSKGYMNTVPKPVRTGIGNVFETIATPISAANLALQGKGKKSLQQVKRFGINLTVGVLGVFDPASDRYSLPPPESDFDQTLQSYGVARGPYLVVPFLGSSDCRALTGSIVDSLTNPLSLLPKPESTFVKVSDALQENAPRAAKYIELHRETSDPYGFFRNLYEQSRRRDEEYREQAE